SSFCIWLASRQLFAVAVQVESPPGERIDIAINAPTLLGDEEKLANGAGYKSNSRPNSRFAAAANSSSVAMACRSTQCSSEIDARYLRKPSASAPTGWRNCQVPLRTISTIRSASIDGGWPIFT